MNEQINKVYDEMYDENKQCLRRYDENGVSFCERIDALFNMSTIIQWNSWDTCFDCGPATIVGSTSVAWIDAEGKLHLEVYDWEE